MDSSVRYFGCAVGFGFGVLWMTQGLGAAILCLLLAGLGYGVVLAADEHPRLADGGEVGRVEAADGARSDHEHALDHVRAPTGIWRRSSGMRESLRLPPGATPKKS